jgi:hypothetical protein
MLSSTFLDFFNLFILDLFACFVSFTFYNYYNIFFLTCQEVFYFYFLPLFFLQVYYNKEMCQKCVRFGKNAIKFRFNFPDQRIVKLTL